MTPSAPLQILVLGGTSWLGGVLARRALARGHAVTCLARGESGDAPTGATWVRADRREGGAYAAVAQQDWDSVVDVSWQPDLVHSALVALADRARHWTYVSSCSVYRDDSVPDTDESAELHEPWTGTGEVTREDYGAAKSACEAACQDSVPADRLLVARAGLIAGYGDRSDRFGYWPARIARSTDTDPVIVPDDPEMAVQVIDVEDLADWILACAEQGTTGIFNAVGDAHPFREVLQSSVTAAERQPDLVAVDQDWLTEQGVQPWAGPESLPLWLPMPEYAGFARRSNRAAKAAGLELRPLAATVAGALRWERELGVDRAGREAGLSAARESELVSAWLARAD